MSTQHTLGPWEVRASFGYYHVSSKFSFGGDACMSGRQGICTAPYESKRGSKRYHEMFAANARLIAAAPDLLDALQSCLSRLECLETPAPGYGPSQPILDARDAIAKALG